jgi:nucleotide-binding universal stress UspA family protein
MRPVMPALSNSQESSRAVEHAIQRAKKGRRLTVVCDVDVNFAHYFAGTDIGLYPELKERCENELLKKHRDKAENKVKSIAKTAEDHGIIVRTYIGAGTFVAGSLKAIQEERPELVITTRSNMPKWIRKLLGSPTDYLSARAECPVIEV